MLGRDQSRKDLHASGGYDEVVKAAAIMLSPVFQDAQTAALRAVSGREFLQQDDAVSDAMDRLVVPLGGQIVQQQYGHVMTCKVMLQRKDLPAIAQGALRKETDFGQAIKHHALWL